MACVNKMHITLSPPKYVDAGNNLVSFQLKLLNKSVWCWDTSTEVKRFQIFNIYIKWKDYACISDNNKQSAYIH